MHIHILQVYASYSTCVCLRACAQLPYMQYIIGLYMHMYVCVCVWSVITGSWTSMLTQTYPCDWPFEINKQTSDWLTQPTSSRVLHEAKKKKES